MQSEEDKEPTMKIKPLPVRLLLLPGIAALLAACSGPMEDPRVTFCKGLTMALVSEGGAGEPAIEWTGGENSFKYPEYAITALVYRLTTAGGEQRSGRSACYYAYEALDDTAQTLADPLSAHATLPFAMTLNGRMLSDAELVAARSAEQKRLGMALGGALEQGARDMAEQIRAGIGQ
jgi:hypothetical protein